MTASDAWYDQEQRMTPDSVLAVTFPLTRWGRHGYEEEPVHAFLNEVHGELIRLVNERASLWQEVQRLRQRILSGENGHDGVLFGEDDAHAHAVRILSNAQLTADRYVADAQAYSGRLTEEARNRRDEIMTQAKQRAEVLLEEARVRARQAADEAMSQEALPPQSAQERRAVEGEIAYLRTFTDVYRQNLKMYTESIQRMLSDWDNKERTMQPPRPVADLDDPAAAWRPSGVTRNSTSPGGAPGH
jgi:cell division septum initiation protein DivIVA